MGDVSIMKIAQKIENESKMKQAMAMLDLWYVTTNTRFLFSAQQLLLEVENELVEEINNLEKTETSDV